MLIVLIDLGIVLGLLSAGIVIVPFVMFVLYRLTDGTLSYREWREAMGV